LSGKRILSLEFACHVILFGGHLLNQTVCHFFKTVGKRPNKYMKPINRSFSRFVASPMTEVMGYRFYFFLAYSCLEAPSLF